MSFVAGASALSSGAWAGIGTGSPDCRGAAGVLRRVLLGEGGVASVGVAGAGTVDGVGVAAAVGKVDAVDTVTGWVRSDGATGVGATVGTASLVADGTATVALEPASEATAVAGATVALSVGGMAAGSVWLSIVRRATRACAAIGSALQLSSGAELRPR